MKKLIYYTIGNNTDYLKLLKIHIESLNNFQYDGDILIITNYQKEIEDLITFENNVFYMNLGESNLLNSSANKLKIYKFEKVFDYDKIIFTDIDTLWFESPDILFDNIKDDKIYVVSEYEFDWALMSHEFWSGGLMTGDEIDFIKKNNIFGISGGFFALKISMINVIKEIDEFFIKNLHKASICLEQPYINTFLFRNNLYDTSFDRYISNNGNNMTSSDDFNCVLLHFAAGVGNANYKYNNMIKFIKNEKMKK